MEHALRQAEEAFAIYRRTPAEARADFLEKIAEEIMALGDELLERRPPRDRPADRSAHRRAGADLRPAELFAEVVREGSWVDARIDTALPDRKPVAEADLRRMLHAARPVVVFGVEQFSLRLLGGRRRYGVRPRRGDAR